NALQAMPEGGILALRSRQLNGEFILHVSDTGAGISRENLQKIFEPFFTTKSDGLGLGLAITKRVMEEHGGRIDFVSEQGKGSEVTLGIPLRTDQAET
ncbi:MAG: ATP-binding protein, partial [Syntrophaceae bacterium]